MTQLVGMDLASTSGVCWGRPQDTPQTRAWKAPVCGDDYGTWGAYWWRTFYNFLDDLQLSRDPGERLILNYEAPFAPFPKWDKIQKRIILGTTIATTRKLQGLGVLLETVCALHPSAPEVYECDIKTIKKELSGTGSADKTAMVAAARRAGVELPPGQEAMDAADGFGAWLVALRHYAPEHLPAWHSRLFSGPGQLPL